ncbi:MAG: hypothetical protein IPN17_24515 [Deltaproteobacteria bacterium]|nr:hypothetical protein [Deltaproteobacteria bacterium]MBK8695347.1 hypothetical protein [Deltaproteobacteria bacterium]
MPELDTVRDRTRFYAQRSGLSQRQVQDFRRTPVNDWPARSDRRIGSAIRGMEAMWQDPDVTLELWLRTAKAVMGAISDFLFDVIDTAVELGSAIARAVDRALEWFMKTVEAAEVWLDEHPRIKRAIELILGVGTLVFATR